MAAIEMVEEDRIMCEDTKILKQQIIQKNF